MYMRRGLGATLDMTSLISQIATSKGVSPALALAVAQHESGFNPNAQNPTSSAAGLFQLVNAAQQTYGVTNPYDPTQNATAGVTFLQQMIQKYGNQDLALMAYAWGPGNVDNWIKGGSNPATVPAEASQFISWVDTNTGSLSTLAAGGGEITPAAGSGSDLSASALDLSSLDLSSLVSSLDPVTLGVGVGIVLLSVFLAFRS